ncbi:MAG: NTP transferase domain-containing protein [Gemmatimonadota bacterium]|nr:NTP transferase domain-containing protein [Gemmatimonadota bacterium]
MTAPQRDLAAVILAAGQGTRMNSAIIKVLHPLAGRQMIRHVIGAVRGVGADRIVCVVGYQRERVEDALSGLPELEFAVQDEQLGTGHALGCAAPRLEGFDGDVLVLCGDTPLLTTESLSRIVEVHRHHDAPATLLTAELDDPVGYGRVVTDETGSVERIVEERDADETIRSIRLVNTGVYCFSWPRVRPLLDRLDPDNVQGELYLTDVMQMLADDGTPGLSVKLDDPVEMLGINDREQLAEAEAVLRDRIRRRLMAEGVTFLSPESSIVDADVKIGPDTVVYPCVVIEGASAIGREAVIGPFTRIVDAHVGRGAELQGWNSIVHTTVAKGAIVKPYVRQGAD